MATWAFGWQFTPEHLAYVSSAIAPDPNPDPGFGQVTTVYDYPSSSVLLHYMPRYLQFDPYIRDLMDAMGEEIAVLRGTLDVLLEQFFLAQTKEWGLQLWEEMAGVAINPDSVSVADRIAGVRSRIVIGPRTLADFEQFLRDFFDGEDGAITENYASYTVDVTVYAAKTTEEQEAFEEAFDAALPAHLSVGTYSYGGFIAGVSKAGDTL